MRDKEGNIGKKGGEDTGKREGEERKGKREGGERDKGMREIKQRTQVIGV